MVQVPLMVIYQLSNSCFLDDIDLVFKIFKNLSDGSTGISARVFSPKNAASDLPALEISNILFSRAEFGLFLYYSCIIRSHLVGAKSNRIVLGSCGHVQKSENHENNGLSVFPKVKSTSS